MWTRERIDTTDATQRMIEELEGLTVGQLRDRYAEVFGEPTRSGNRQWLLRRVAWRLQGLAEGDLSDRARRRAAELARDADIRLRPPSDRAPALGADVRTGDGSSQGASGRSAAHPGWRSHGPCRWATRDVYRSSAESRRPIA